MRYYFHLIICNRIGHLVIFNSLPKHQYANVRMRISYHDQIFHLPPFQLNIFISNNKATSLLMESNSSTYTTRHPSPGPTDKTPDYFKYGLIKIITDKSCIKRETLNNITTPFTLIHGSCALCPYDLIWKYSSRLNSFH